MEIMWVESGEIFSSVKVAAKKLDISEVSIYQSLKRKCAANGKHFVWCPTREVAEHYANKLLDELNAKEVEKWEKKKQTRQRREQFEESRRQQKEQREELIIDLFKSWWVKELSIEECAERMGCSTVYAYKRFRAEQTMRGLTKADRRHQLEQE